MSDYMIAKRLIQSGKTTWAKLVKTGKALAASKTGPKNNTAEWMLAK